MQLILNYFTERILNIFALEALRRGTIQAFPMYIDYMDLENSLLFFFRLEMRNMKKYVENMKKYVRN